MSRNLLRWGNNPQLVFENEHEFYRALGHLSNPKAYTISYEFNKRTGSYSDACRIRILASAKNIPQAFEKKKKTNNRINCNEYIMYINENHNFVQTGNVYEQNIQNVLPTIPTEYISDYMQGYKESSDVDENAASIVCYTCDVVNTKDKTLSEVSQPHPRKSNSKTSTKRKTIGKRDYIAQQIKNFELGEAGEALVYKHECQKIKAAQKVGAIDESVIVDWVSRYDDSKGYDIESFDIKTKKPKYIEVKTTSGQKNTPFYISDKELKTSEEKADDYYIYRVYGLKRESDEKINYYVINGDLKKQDNFEVSKIEDNIVKIKSSELE